MAEPRREPAQPPKRDPASVPPPGTLPRLPQTIFNLEKRGSSERGKRKRRGRR
jgi:hypothetical protein